MGAPMKPEWLAAARLHCWRTHGFIPDDYIVEAIIAGFRAAAEKDGWKLVPREATGEMEVAGGRAAQKSIGSWGEPGLAWRAMWDAAPKERR